MNSFAKSSRALVDDIWNYMHFLLTSCVLNKQMQGNMDEEIQASIDKAQQSYDAIVNEVKTRGFYILHNAISDTILNQMRDEFHTIIDDKSNDFYGVDRHEGSVCVRVKPALTFSNLRDFPVIHAFYNSSIFRALTKHYYKDEDVGSEYMAEIFVHETPETNDPLSGTLHWDRAQTLKFWVYLDEVPETAGPMIVEENSPKRNKKMRLEMHKEKSTLVGGVDNVLNQTPNALIPMTAEAGSILIHNTDASHGASNVQSGMVRRIIRGHCRAR